MTLKVVQGKLIRIKKEEKGDEEEPTPVKVTPARVPKKSQEIKKLVVSQRTRKSIRVASRESRQKAPVYMDITGDDEDPEGVEEQNDEEEQEEEEVVVPIRK